VLFCSGVGTTNVYDPNSPEKMQKCEELLRVNYFRYEAVIKLHSYSCYIINLQKYTVYIKALNRQVFI